MSQFQNEGDFYGQREGMHAIKTEKSPLKKGIGGISISNDDS